MKETEKTYPTEALLRSKAFAGYQRDFARALLPKSAYSIREAKQILDKFFHKRGDRKSVV